MPNSGSEAERKRRPDRPLQRIAMALAALALLLLACRTTLETTLPDEIPNATPPFFEISGGRGATLQLLGTIHLGPAEGWSFAPEIDRALAQATTLVMEIDLSKATEEAVSDAILRYGMLPDESSLSQIITAETAQLIEQHDAELTAIGLPGGLRERLKPWFIALSLVESTSGQTRYLPGRSVDQQVFSALGSRELIALETLDEQLRFFGELSPDLQELILQDSLMRYATAPDSIEELVGAWRANDQDTLVRLAREGVETLPELDAFFDILLDVRNRNWLPTLTRLLESPDRAGTTILVAVGSLHLVGPGSLPDLLRREGYRAVQPTRPLARETAARGRVDP